MKFFKSWSSIDLCLIPLLSVSAFLSGFIVSRNRIESSISHTVRPACPPLFENIEFVHKIEEGETLSEILDHYYLSSKEKFELIESIRTIFDPTKFREGKEITFIFQPYDMSLRSFRYEVDDETTLLVRDTGSFTAEFKKLDLTTIVGRIQGKIEDNLWNSALKTGMQPKDIVSLAEVFEWDIDFNTELRNNDSFDIMIEEKYHGERLHKLGKILGAKFVNNGREHYGIYFETSKGEKGYYNLEGRSLKKAFLRSPIKYSRITSGFSMRRFHPILKKYKPHLGIDYAAPAGTPVRAVGSGTVLFAGYSGGSGNMVKIRHNSIYSSAYCHLKGFARNIRKGVKIQQGDVIGYVGSTGLSTGPHLHFAFYKYGRHVNFLNMKFEPSEPVPPEDMERFELIKREFLRFIGEG